MPVHKGTQGAPLDGETMMLQLDEGEKAALAALLKPRGRSIPQILFKIGVSAPTFGKEPYANRTAI